jgi:predicted amidohydrolase
MQDIRIGLIQANQIWENKEANLLNYERLIGNVSSADIYVLPEMFHTGFSMSAHELAEEENNSKGLDWLTEMALRKNAAFYTSLIIKSKNGYLNRGVFVEPNGAVTYYDKRQLFSLAGEDLIYKPGEKLTILEYKGWLINLQICYDLRFPEISRNYLTQSGYPAYDLLIYVANWPEKRSSHWKSLLIARAIENQAYVVGVNRVGTDGNDLSYCGDSCCITPLGEIDFCEKGIEEHKLVLLSKMALNEVRNNLPFLKDIK